MDMSNLINLQGTLFMAMGVVLHKYNIIPEAGSTILTDLVIYVILPCNIINSFRMNFNMEILKGFAVILLVSFAIQTGCLIISNTLYNKEPIPVKKVLQYATVCSNAGFIGNPIVGGVFGVEGLMYASIFLIPQRIIMWSAGVSFFTENSD